MSGGNYTYLLNPIVTAPTTTAITATGHYIAMIFQPIPGKTITGVDFYCTASTSGVVDFTLETVDAGTFVPSGTLVATGVSATNVSVSANTWYTNSFTNSYAVPTAATNYLAVVARWVSGSATLNSHIGTIGQSLPRTATNAGTVTQRSSPPACSVIYSDGTRHPYCAPCITLNSTGSTFSPTSSPDEYGNIYLPDCNQVVVGIQILTRVISGGTTQLRIYDENLNVMTTDSELVTDVRQSVSTSGGNITYYMLRTPIYLIAGRTYYITQTATSNNTYYYRTTFGDSARRAHYSPYMYGVSRTDGTGAFTTDDTVVHALSPIIDMNYGLAKDGLTGGIIG